MNSAFKRTARLPRQLQFQQTHPSAWRYGHGKRLFSQSQSFKTSRPSNPSKYSFTTPQILITLGISASFSLATYFWTLNSNTSHQYSPPSTRSTTPLSKDNTPIYNLSPQNLASARSQLEALLGKENVIDHLPTLISHSSTAWSPAPNGSRDHPSLIVYPSTTLEVSKIAKICHQHLIPMIAFSGGTSLEGTLAAQNSEICIDFKRMNRILEINREDMDVVVQPGVGYVELNEVLGKEGGGGLFFPPDPGPGAQIGGMIAQGCSGTNAYRYGTMKDWVLGLTVVLADGTIIKTRGRPRKSSAGYDLTRLFVASEGTLGFVTEASLRVTLKPRNIRVAVASFSSLEEATGTTMRMQEMGRQVEAMELLDDVTMHALNEAGYTETQWPVRSTVFFKFAGESEEGVQRQIDFVEEVARGNGCEKFVRSETDEQAEALWAARKTALWSLLAIKRDPDDEFLSADVCVPIGRLADIIGKTKKMLDESGLVGSCLGHVGDGNFHTTVLYSPHEKPLARKIIRDVQKLGVDMHGTVTGEHGIGLENRDALIYELGEESVDAMRRVKYALDPLGLLNPGKIMRLRVDEGGEVERKRS